jgi:hypothetical protein
MTRSPVPFRSFEPLDKFDISTINGTELGNVGVSLALKPANAPIRLALKAVRA